MVVVEFDGADREEVKSFPVYHDRLAFILPPRYRSLNQRFMASAALVLQPTPIDYHKVISPTLQIPKDPSISVPVGILACQRDPLLRSITTNVVSVTVHQPPAQPAKKSGKKAVIAPETPKDPLLEVILQDTVIFPEGGGQPTDTGIIKTITDGKSWDVFQAKRHGGHAVHYVRVKDADVNAALLAFAPGVPVEASLDQQGWDRRYDHMSLHTSQHLLSALLEKHLKLPTLSWSLTTAPQPCYVEIPRGMSPGEINLIQETANKLVFEGRRVHVEVAELDATQTRSSETTESGRSIGKGLPEDYTGGVKRVVVIDGVDRNPCCGTHLPSLNNLQLFLLPHTDALARSNSSTARLYFLAGPRLITYLTSAHSLLTNTASTLSCGAPLVPERVTQVIEERKKAEKRVNDLEDELAQVISRNLADQLAKAPAETTVLKRHIHRTDDSSNPLGFLNSIASAFSAVPARTRDQPYVIVLTSSPSSQTATSVSTVVVFGTAEAKVKEAGDALRSKLMVKGGGKGPKWSGKYTGVWRVTKESVAVDDLLAGL